MTMTQGADFGSCAIQTIQRRKLINSGGDIDDKIYQMDKMPPIWNKVWQVFCQAL